MKIGLRKIIFRKVVGTSEDWPYFYSGFISSSTSTNFPATFATPWRSNYFTLVSHILKQKLLPLNVPYLPKHRLSQTYKGTMNKNDSEHTVFCTLTARNPDCICWLWKSLYGCFIFQVYIFCPLQGVSSNSFNNLLSLIFLTWCLWMLHPQGKKKIAWSQWKGFGNMKIKLGILDNLFIKSPLLW